MSKYFLFQDLKKCIGCHSCAIACKSNKNLPVGPRISEIVMIGPEFIAGLPRSAHIFMPCFHCENPWCVAACPTGAMQKRPKDGIVFIDPNLCVGCKTCMVACPWGAPQWNPDVGKMVKCDYCMDRIDEGLEPACVTVCTTHCLHFGEVDAIPNVRRKRYAKSFAALGESH